jgi:transcriptional regulator with XRE-family HTH domain
LYNKYVQLRDSKGLTDYKVALDTGITKSTFTDWKNGRSEPKIEKLAKIAEYFEVTVDYFVKE